MLKCPPFDSVSSRPSWSSVATAGDRWLITIWGHGNTITYVEFSDECFRFSFKRLLREVASTFLCSKHIWFLFFCETGNRKNILRIRLHLLIISTKCSRTTFCQVKGSRQRLDGKRDMRRYKETTQSPLWVCPQVPMIWSTEGARVTN